MIGWRLPYLRARAGLTIDTLAERCGVRAIHIKNLESRDSGILTNSLREIVRVVGALGAQYRPFRREDIVSTTDLDVFVESRVLSDAKQFNKSRNFEGYLSIIAQDPTANLRYGFKRLGKLKGLKKDEIDLLLPPTIEELRAEDENKQLEADELVEVLPTDDHVTHLEIHNKLSDTPAKYAHIEAHKRAMLLARVRPDLIPQLPSAQNPTGGQGMQQGSGTKAPVNEANVTM